MVRYTLVGISLYVGHPYTMVSGRFKIDIIISYPVPDNGFQLLCMPEQIPADGRTPDQDALRLPGKFDFCTDVSGISPVKLKIIAIPGKNIVLIIIRSVTGIYVHDK